MKHIIANLLDTSLCYILVCQPAMHGVVTNERAV